MHARSYGYGHFVIKPKPFPEWMVELLAQAMPILGINDPSQWPDSCNLNWYRGGWDSVAWHADSEDLLQGKQQPIRIISLSLGDSTAFQVREQQQGSTVVTQTLSDGDLCLMDGTFHQYYKHQVPKTQGFKKDQQMNSQKNSQRHSQSTHKMFHEEFAKEFTKLFTKCFTK